MIVTNVEAGWEIVYQPAHGLLAGQIAAQFAESLRCDYWFETKVAITVHDDQKLDLESDERNYVTEVGAPKDFTLVPMSDDQRFREVRERLRNAYRKHRWIGLLESSHAHTLYAGKEVDADLAKLLEQQRSKRTKVARQLSTKLSNVQQAYEIMQWCDRCSLILCQQKLPAMQRRVEVSPLGGDRYEIWQRADESLGVSPWPFAAESFQLDLEFFELNQLAFENDRELGEALENCAPQIRSWTFRSEE